MRQFEFVRHAYTQLRPVAGTRPTPHAPIAPHAVAPFGPQASRSDAKTLGSSRGYVPAAPAACSDFESVALLTDHHLNSVGWDAH